MFTVQKMSVKRKRMSLRQIPSSSSEESPEAPATESDLSDSVSAESPAQSAGEEEPPTKRKRDKMLKTAAERNRKSSRTNAAAVVSSPSSGVQTTKQEGAGSEGGDKDSNGDSSDKVCAQKCSPSSDEDDRLASNSVDTEKVEMQNVDGTCMHNEDERVSTSASVSADNSRHSAAENTAPDKTDGTTCCDSVSAGQDNSSETECSGDVGRRDNKCSARESHEKECSDTCIKQNSYSVEATDVGNSVAVSADAESLSKVTLNGSCTEDENRGRKSFEDNNHAEDNEKTRCTDVLSQLSAESVLCEGENNSDSKPADKLTSNGLPASSAKKPRGRPKKSSKKRDKKRVRSNVTNSSSVIEVQETDYEPTKKLGRPSKKSKLAQLVAEEGCDSLPQSEDDIPLIELRRSSRANKGQRMLDQVVFDQPKKRNRRKDEVKERKRAEKEEKRRKREAELQEQAALKAKKVGNLLLLLFYCR